MARSSPPIASSFLCVWYPAPDSRHHREGIDISVHCDVEIFDWLIRHIKVRRRTTLVVRFCSTFSIQSRLCHECFFFPLTPFCSLPFPRSTQHESALVAEEHQTHPPEDHTADCLDCSVQGHLDLDDSAAHPSLSVKNVVSVLISSEFLQMNKLVEDCLRCEASLKYPLKHASTLSICTTFFRLSFPLFPTSFCHENMAGILKTPTNLSCINPKLLSRYER